MKSCCQDQDKKIDGLLATLEGLKVKNSSPCACSLPEGEECPNYVSCAVPCSKPCVRCGVWDGEGYMTHSGIRESLESIVKAANSVDFDSLTSYVGPTVLANNLRLLRDEINKGSMALST